jgi:hypothetical protein
MKGAVCRCPLLLALAGAVGLLSGASAARAADPKYEWMALRQVRRIAIVSPYFCSDALRDKPTDLQSRAYQKEMQTLTDTLRRTLPHCLAEQNRFQIAPVETTERTLRNLRWSPRDLFYYGGRCEERQWPAPDRKRIATLAKRLKVDALFVGAMHEPASVGDSVQLHHGIGDPNPLDWKLQRIRPHVLSPRVQAFLVTQQGVLAWQDEQVADHPRTKQHTTRTLLIDWQEATEQVAQQLADSLLRLPPPTDQ